MLTTSGLISGNSCGHSIKHRDIYSEVIEQITAAQLRQMGSECRPSKFHYDIAMSKRTRKSSNPIKETTLQERDSAEESSEVVVNGEKDKNSASFGLEAQENDNTKSQNQLIEGRSLSQVHSTAEENQLQLSVKQQEEGLNRVKFKRMVSRYGRVLSHLIKLKRKPEMAFRKKPRLTK